MADLPLILRPQGIPVNIGVIGVSPESINLLPSPNNQHLTNAYAKELLRKLNDPQSTTIISTPRLGWNMAFLHAARSLAIKYVMVTIKGKSDTDYVDDLRLMYRSIRSAAADIVEVKKHEDSLICARNQHNVILELSDEVFFLWNNAPAGLIYQALSYAQVRGTPMVNLHAHFTQSGQYRQCEQLPF